MLHRSARIDKYVAVKITRFRTRVHADERHQDSDINIAISLKADVVA